MIKEFLPYDVVRNDRFADIVRRIYNNDIVSDDDLDYAIKRLYNGELIVIASRPAMR